MNTLKLGSVGGEDLNLLSRLLEIEPRPEFDRDLEEVVKEYQREHGLSVDGEVGYLSYEDSQGPTFTDPEKAAEYSRTRPNVIYYPLYDRDGTTVVGRFRNGPAR